MKLMQYVNILTEFEAYKNGFWSMAKKKQIQSKQALDHCLFVWMFLFFPL